jgi:alanine racemase
VTLISSDKNSGCTAEDLAKLAGTINYEITTMIPRNIPRVIV